MTKLVMGSARGRLTASLAVVAALLVQSVRVVRLHKDEVRSLRNDLAVLLSTSAEDRRLATYGDRDGWGYGYLRTVASLLPDEAALPVIRTGVGVRSVGGLLPGYRYRTDHRVIVGIGLGEDSWTDRVVAKGVSVAGESGGWTFTTEQDCDLFVGVRVILSRRPTVPAITVEASLFVDEAKSTELGKWRRTSPGTSASVDVGPAEPLEGFSTQRGRTPFLVTVTTRPELTPIQEVSIIGRRVDLRECQVIQREGKCWTAVRVELLNAPGSGAAGPWQRLMTWSGWTGRE